MASNPAPVAMSPEALRLLREIDREAGDGYGLMARTRLKGADFEKAVQILLDLALIEVRGDISGERLGESFFYVPQSAQGRAGLFLGRFGDLQRAIK